MLYEMTIRIAAMNPASAKKLAEKISDAAEGIFQDFTMSGRNIGPMSMDVGELKKVEGKS